MRIPLSWLAEFVTWSGPAAALAERLTMAGLKLEAIEEVGRLDRRIVAGRLAAVEPHPEADRVQVCRVEVGRPAPLVAVSGAPGLAAGQMIPVALPGARLPDGHEAQAVRIRGVESAGVLCSEAELALGEDASQVLVLPDDAAPGTPLAALPGIADTVLEAEVTPNRGDWLSILGVAREVAAVTGARRRRPRPRPRESGAAAGREVRVRVQAADLCPRYCARVVRGVGIVPAPLWVRLRLRRAGMRALNAVVDATNYVMLERGQPLHAFDLERLVERRIVVRRGAAGERLTTLDGVDRVLEPDDLVIADGRGPVALAGVMGGEASEVTSATRVLLLESAFFAPATGRRTSRRLALPSQPARARRHLPHAARRARGHAAVVSWGSPSRGGPDRGSRARGRLRSHPGRPPRGTARRRRGHAGAAARGPRAAGARRRGPRRDGDHRLHQRGDEPAPPGLRRPCARTARGEEPALLRDRRAPALAARRPGARAPPEPGAGGHLRRRLRARQGLRPRRPRRPPGAARGRAAAGRRLAATRGRAQRAAGRLPRPEGRPRRPLRGARPGRGAGLLAAGGGDRRAPSRQGGARRARRRDPRGGRRPPPRDHAIR